MTDRQSGQLRRLEALDFSRVRLHFSINSAYLEDGIGFLLQTDGGEYALTDVVYRSEGSSGSDGGVSGASSGGCGTGFSGLAGLAVIGILMLMRRK